MNNYWLLEEGLCLVSSQSFLQGMFFEPPLVSSLDDALLCEFHIVVEYLKTKAKVWMFTRRAQYGCSLL
jgi:hypothetical protein